MELSDRIKGLLGGGAAWALYARARDMAARGLPVVELTIGEHDVPTHPEILAALRAAAHAGNTGYTPIAGLPALRDAVAARVAARSGVPTGRENVLIVPGGQAGLFAAHAAALEPGQTGLFVDPYYATYPGTIRAVGGVPVAARARAEDGFLPRAGALDAAAAAHDAASLLINSPNNPTGAVYPPETLAQIAEAAQARGLWVISDEVYETQVWEGVHQSIRALPGMAARTLVIGSLSKSHAMTGSRIGWVVGPPEAIAALAALAIHTTYGLPGYIQEAALFALTQGAGLEDEVAAPFRRRRAVARSQFETQNTLRLSPASGAMYLFVDVRATGLSGQAFAERLLDEERIAVMPGESFGDAAAGHIRIAMTVDDQAFTDALARLIGFAQRITP